MKKRWMFLLLFLMISGCGKSDADKDAGASVPVGAAESEQTAVQGPAGQDGAVEEQAADHKGYVFVYDDIVMEIDLPASAVLPRLGEPNSYFEAPSCAFNGIDKIYTFNSFEVDTYPFEGEDRISSILFRDDSVATMEGIGIGDPVEELIAAYGEDSTEENGVTVYHKDGMKLCFIIEEGCVSSIEYKTTVLDE